MARMVSMKQSGGKKAPGGGKAREAEIGFASLLSEASQRGFFGTVTLTVNVQDGFIQQVRLASDRVVR